MTASDPSPSSEDVPSAVELRLRRALQAVAEATPLSEMPTVNAVEPTGRRRSIDERSMLRWRLTAAAAVLLVIIASATVYVSRRDSGRVDLTPTARTTAPTVGTIPSDLGPRVAPDFRSQDHWHAAYGFYVCDAFLPPFNDATTNDELGIHTHGEGVIHIHPFSAASSGANARLDRFGAAIGVAFSKDGFTMPDGTVYRNGLATCGGEPAKVVVYRWPAEATTGSTSPGTGNAEVFTQDFDRITFSADRQAYTFAVVPLGATPPPPRTIAQLDQLSDVPPSSSGPASSATTVPSPTAAQR